MPWDGDWAFVGDRGTLTVRDLAVDDLNTGNGPRRVATIDPPSGDDDLAVAWRDFVRAIDGVAEPLRFPTNVGSLGRHRFARAGRTGGPYLSTSVISKE